MYKTLITYLSLLLISLLSGILWRYEVDYHGWAGLTWISYDHQAIPICFGLFLIWANLFTKTSLFRRVAANVLAIALGVGLYFGITNALVYTFVTGPSAMGMLFIPGWKISLYRLSFFFFIAVLPLAGYGILRIIGRKIHPVYLATAVMGMVMSIPLSTALLELVNHQGGHNLIHAFKSGYIFPFWVFSAGLAVVGQISAPRSAETNRDQLLTKAGPPAEPTGAYTEPKPDQSGDLLG